MKSVLKSLALVAVFSAALPLTARAFTAVNSLVVNQVDANVIEVVGRPGAFKEDYWCGIGDYVRRELGLPWKTRIYVVSGLGRSVTTGAIDAATFTLNPQAIGIEPYEKSLITDILTIGYSRSLNGAFDQCHRRNFLNIRFGVF
jgi:hypothetical protein